MVSGPVETPLQRRKIRFTPLELSGVALFLLGAFLSWTVGALMQRPPSVSLGSVSSTPICASLATGQGSASPADAHRPATSDVLHLFSAEATQLGMFVLLYVIAGIGLAAAVLVVGAVVRDWYRSERATSWGAGLWLLVGGGVSLTLRYVLRTQQAAPSGFLSQLLTTLDAFPTCARFRNDVETARLVGEGTAFLMATAMAATAVVITPTAERVATRVQLLQRLLYVASLLFVAGILVSSSNFSLVLANWAGQAADDKLGKAVQEVVSSGGIQSGVGYSALIAIFYLPARFYLAVQTDRLVAGPEPTRRAARAQLLKDNGVPVSWWEDAKQILALLAPVLATPVFDAIAKPK